MPTIRRKAPVPLAILALAGFHLLVAAGAPGPSSDRRVVVVGFDGLDPTILEAMMEAGELPAFRRLAARGAYARLGTSTPPQSPVAWSTFLTGTNPGRHGIFDFIHRDPATYSIETSTTRVEPPGWVVPIGDWRIPLDSPSIELERAGEPFWNRLVEAGHPVVAIKVPADYPPSGERGRVLAGMGVPDLAGTYGEYHYYTDRDLEAANGPGRVHRVRLEGGRLETALEGPPNTLRAGAPRLAVPLAVRIDPDRPAAHVALGDSWTVLEEGQWSEWLPVSFDPGPLAPRVAGMCRVYLQKIRPWFGLYVSPVNADPFDPAIPISHPEDFCGHLASRVGRYYTKGMAEETAALGADVLGDAEFLAQTDLVLVERERLLESALAEYAGGLLFFYVSTSDLVSHMFWRAVEPGHPAGPPDLPPRADPVRETYRRLDRMLGRVLDAAGEDTTVLVLSDHGFASYRRSFDVNAWLEREGWLALAPGAPRDLSGVDWSRTRAYGVGFNGLYLNLAGREGQGIVEAPEAEALARMLAKRLLAIVDPATGERVFARVDAARDVYRGARAGEAPDLVLGYARGYRTGPESALGGVGREVLFDNVDRWSGDHLIAPELVPGVLLATRPFRTDPGPTLLDLAPTILAEFGLPPGDLEGEDLFERSDD